MDVEGEAVEGEQNLLHYLKNEKGHFLQHTIEAKSCMILINGHLLVEMKDYSEEMIVSQYDHLICDRWMTNHKILVIHMLNVTFSYNCFHQQSLQHNIRFLTEQHIFIYKGSSK